MPRKSPKPSCKRRCRRRAGARGARGARRATGRPPSCRTCPRPPSARPSRAASPRCRRWRRGGARGRSWSGARWTWSASCGPTARPTTRWTSASACDRATV